MERSPETLGSMSCVGDVLDHPAVPRRLRASSGAEGLDAEAAFKWLHVRNARVT